MIFFIPEKNWELKYYIIITLSSFSAVFIAVKRCFHFTRLHELIIKCRKAELLVGTFLKMFCFAFAWKNRIYLITNAFPLFCVFKFSRHFKNYLYRVLIFPLQSTTTRLLRIKATDAPTVVIGYPYKRRPLAKNIPKFLFLTLKHDSWLTQPFQKCEVKFCLVKYPLTTQLLM